MSTTENNKAVISKFVEEVINQNRMDRADDLVVEDFVELDPLPGQRQGREGLKEVLGMMRAAYPDIHRVVEEMVAEGDTVPIYMDGHASGRVSWGAGYGQECGC
jgi:predicted SnoaL-like aldol condensation-catalyzing enzyme